VPTVDLGIRVRLDPNKVTDGRPHSDMANAIHDKIISSILNDVNQYTKSDGSRITDPRVRIQLAPTHIIFDLIGDLQENEPAIRWFTNNYNGAQFRSKLSEAIHKCLLAWARKNYKDITFVDQTHIWTQSE